MRGLRLTVLLATAAVAVLTMASPAAAHGRGSDATNYRSRVVEAPDLPGVTWRIYGGDEYLGVRNESDQEVAVLGYEDEPYLRVGPEGVFENRNSPATYLNADRFAATTPPPEAGPDAEPDWVRIGDGPAHAWHDHRTHWMSPQPPPPVRDAPGTEQVVALREGTDTWGVPFQYGGATLEVQGRLVWVPAPPPWPWVAVALVLVAPAVLGLRAGRAGSTAALVRPAAVVLGVVALLNVTHLIDDLTATPLPLTAAGLTAVQTALFIAIGVFGAVRAWQAGDGAPTALGVGSGAIVIGQGLLYLSVLQASQSASVFPDAIARLVVAASLVQALPCLVVAVVGIRRLAPQPPAAIDATAA